MVAVSLSRKRRFVPIVPCASDSPEMRGGELFLRIWVLPRRSITPERTDVTGTLHRGSLGEEDTMKRRPGMLRDGFRFALLATLITTTSVTSAGCRTPHWWAYRSMGCLPQEADSHAAEYWQRCEGAAVSQGISSPSDVRAAQAKRGGATTLQDLAAPREPGLEVSPARLRHPAAIREKVSDESSSHDQRPEMGNAAGVFRLASHTAPAELASNVLETPSRIPSGSFVPSGPIVKPIADDVQDPVAGEGKNDPLRLPAELPGANTPPLVVPDAKNQDSKIYREQIRGLFPDLPPVNRDPSALPDATTAGIVGLESLHQIARANHPGLRAAAASVEAARGAMIQAGLPPNPNFGYEADTVRTLNTPGYKGAYLQQTIVTARKLGLAAEAAAVDYANAVISQRKTWVTVTSKIRRSYFQVLASRQRVVLANALLELSERAYHAQIQLVAAGEAAPYEPLQLRVLTTQARASLIRAQQDSIAAWRTLAAATGMPDLSVSALEGKIDCAVPEIAYESAVQRLIALHTDVQIAENTIRKQQSLVQLADRQNIPDLDVGFVLQRDYTFQPGGATYNLMLGGAIPVLNQNQGNRIAARAELVKAGQNVADTRNTLISELAGTYGVYQSNRQLADSFKSDALRDQVRAYRGVYQRYLADPSGVSFNDVIVAQQTVASVLNQYLDILQAQWQSVVDIGQLLQVDDLFEMGDRVEVAQFPAIDTEIVSQ